MNGITDMRAMNVRIYVMDDMQEMTAMTAMLEMNAMNDM